MTLSIDELERAVAAIARAPGVDWHLSACGLTRGGREILALVNRDAYEPVGDRVRLVLVGGLSGIPGDVAIALRALRFIAAESGPPGIVVAAVPCANPGGLATGVGPGNGSGGRIDDGYPPAGGFFNHPTDPEARYIWRWACFQAPDAVIEVRRGPETGWEANQAAANLLPGLGAGPAAPPGSLIAALGRGAPTDPGPIPGFRLTVDNDSLERELGRFLQSLAADRPGRSRARRVLEARAARDAFEVGRDLARTNGRTMDPFNYTQGVAISGRLRLALLEADAADSVGDVKSLVEPALGSLGDDPGAPALATVVWAEEMALLTGDDRYGDVLAAAMHQFKARAAGEPPYPLDRNFIVEDHFFASAVIGRGAHIRTDSNTAGYVNALTDFILQAGIQDESGLYRHSRRGPIHWGRGNGFAAMGLAEYLTYIPANWRRDGGAIESKYRRHMQALVRLQHPSGMYLQVLDRPGSYPELTATCMIGYAMARGIRLGLLGGEFRQAVGRAWRAASARIDAAGNVTDGCTGTGVMDGLQSYLDRPANSGYDDRTGSMALWFAAEIARLTVEESAAR